MKGLRLATATFVLLVPLSLATAAGAADTTTTAPVASTTLPTTTLAPTTTLPAITTTLPTTTTLPVTTSTSLATTTTSSTTTTLATTSTGLSGGNTTGIIIGVLAILLIGVLVYAIMRSRRRTSFATNAGIVAADASALAAEVERSLALVREPGAASQVWADLNRRIARVRASLRNLDPSAVGAEGTAAVARLTQALDSLQSALDTDQGLRIGPPTPTDDQLAYSEAVLRQRATEVARAAEGLGPSTPST